jgi:hypothetical protein
MSRHWLIAVAAFATLPAIASAQAPRALDDGWGPMLRATPFIGWSPSFNSSGNLAIFTGGVNPRIESATYSYDYAYGPITGVNFEARAHNQFSGVGQIAWSSRSRTTALDEDGFEFEEPGSDFWFVKVGGLMRFREDSELQLRRLNAAIFAGPAFIREVPDVSILSGSSFTKARNHWGFNFGAEAEMPLSNRMLAFQAAFEDNMIWWDEIAVQQRLAANIRNSYGSEAVAEVDSDLSHMFVLRLGLSVRFR